VGNDGETRIWDITPGGAPALGAIEVSSGRPFILEFSPDGDEVAVSTWEGTLERRVAASGQLLASMDGFMSDAVVNPVISPSWDFVAAVNADGVAGIWDVRGPDSPPVLLPSCTNPRAISPDGSAIVLDAGYLCLPGDAPPGSELRSRVIDIDSGKELLDLGERLVFRAAFTPDGMFEPGRYLAVNIFTEVLEVYDMVTGELLASLEVLPTMIRFDPTGRYLASGTLDGRVVVLDLAARVGGTAVEDALVMDATVATGGVPGIALTADGVLATSAFDSPFIRLWDIHTGGLLAELRTGLDGSSPPQLNFSPDGSYLLYPDAGNVLRKFYIDTDHLVDLARTRVTRPLSEDECRRFLDPVTCD
jgi:WD40 repeat protein